QRKVEAEVLAADRYVAGQASPRQLREPRPCDPGQHEHDSEDDEDALHQAGTRGKSSVVVRTSSRRWVASSKRVPRCMVQRLSQMTTSPPRHLWRWTKRACVACSI